MAKRAGSKSSIGVRELKTNPRRALERVRQGEVVTITVRSRPAALLVPSASNDDAALLTRALANAGLISWSGGKPRGLSRPPRVLAASMAQAVIEDRR